MRAMSADAGDKLSPMVTLRDLAQATGLSRAAVSYALRNNPKVPEATRRRVQECAKKLGYRQDPDVQKLMERLREIRRVRRHAKIAIISPEFSREEIRGDRIIQEMQRGIEARAEELGYGIELFTLAEFSGNAKRLRTILLTRNIEGCILTPLGEAHGAGKVSLEFSDIAAVAIGYSIREPRLNRVCTHHMQMMKDTVGRLVSSGYRKIGLVLNHRYDDGSHNLLAAAFLYLQQKLPARRRIPILYSEQNEDAETLRWLRRHQPDVVIGLPRIYDLLVRRGFRVPNKISFCCLDVARDERPFAGLDHRYRQIGAAATDMVIEHIVLNRKGLPTEPRVLMVDNTWRAGNSVRSDPVKSRSRVSDALI